MVTIDNENEKWFLHGAAAVLGSMARSVNPELRKSVRLIMREHGMEPAAFVGHAIVSSDLDPICRAWMLWGE